MLSPLKEEVENDIPVTNLLEWKHRARWTGNRCLRTLYRVLRTIYVSLWLYFIPFIALALNFIVPFMIATYGEEDAGNAENMSDDYLAWLEETVNSGDNDYTEPSIEELVQMMEEVPLQTDEWTRDP